MNAAEIKMADRIQTIIMGDVCSSMNFRLGGVLVDGSSFSFVALSLVAGKQNKKGALTVKIEKQQASVAASYIAKKNILEVPNPSYGAMMVGERSSIVHECTHALIDAKYKGKKSPGKLIDEACAYIAGAYFFIRSGGNFTSIQPIFIFAHKVALNMSSNIDQFKYKDVYNLDSSTNASNLMSAINSHPVYQNTSDSAYVNDGIKI